MKTLTLLLVLLLVPMVSATLDDEIVLDEATNYDFTTILSDSVDRVSNFYKWVSPQYRVFKDGSLIKSYTKDVEELNRQLFSAEDSETESVELTLAKENLEESKDTVTTMFFYITATLTVILDIIISILYMFSVMLVIWVVFTGYAKLLMLVIEFISGKIIKNGGLR